ncbi:MAG: phage antirepressor KilAC domain-containing protein [Leptospira sp.]|nr:phage antirepressor KilAC domain-containing protein [Leptospira sp.]
MELKGNKKYNKNEVKMSIKEVANILQVTPEAIRKHLRVNYPGFMINGIQSLLTDEMVTEIRKCMLPSTRVEGVYTEQEIQNMIKIVLEWYTQKIYELEKRIAQPTPFDDYQGNFSFSAVAKILDIGKGRNDFIALLREMKILMKQSQFNEPYQIYIDQKYFVVICFINDNINRLMPVTYVTPKGLEWLYKLFNKKGNIPIISSDTFQNQEERTNC